MSQNATAFEGARERRRVRWATIVAVVLDLLLPSLFPADRHDVVSRLAAITTFLTAAVGAALWLHEPWRPVGVGLVRGSAAVFLFVLVLLPLVLFAVSTLGFM